MRILILLPLAFIGIFYAYPLVTIFAEGLIAGGALNVDAFRLVLTSAYYHEVMGFTVGQALLSTVLTLALALPTGFVFARYRFPFKQSLLAAAVLPFVLPTVVVAAAFTALIGQNGLLNMALMALFNLSAPPIQLERSLTIILIAHIFYNYGVALRIIAAGFALGGVRLEEAAQSLGVSGWRLWWLVRLPLLRPALVSAASLVFTFTFTSFGVIIILGGARFATIEVEIYQQVSGLLNFPVASVLSLIQMGILFVVLAVYARNQGGAAFNRDAAARFERPQRRFSERLAVLLTVGIVCVLIILPLSALLIRSLMVDGVFSLLNFNNLFIINQIGVLFVAPASAVITSAGFAVITLIAATVLGLILALFLAKTRSKSARWLDPLLMLPLATSAVTLGFGFLVTFDAPPLNFRSSIWMVPVAHALAAVPFVIRAVLPALRSIQPAYEDAARTLGASPLRVWRSIQVPLAARGVFVGAAFAFAISLGEFGASVFVARPDSPTLPIVIFRLLGLPGASNYGQALALSVILLLICGAAFLLIERIRTHTTGDF